MLTGIIFHTLRMFIESVFCYSVYNHKNEDIIFQKCNIKKMAIFSSTHVIILSLYRYLFADYITYRVLSVFIIFAYFLAENWIENKQNKKSNLRSWNYILTFSIFITLMTECCTFTGAVITRFSWQWAGIYEISETNLLLDGIYRFIALFLHCCFMFLMYKIRFIKMKDIKNISIHKEIPLLFGLCLLTVVYIKYHYNHLGVSVYSSILAWVFMFLLPMYLGFYRHSCRLSKLINSNKNLVAQNRIFDWIVHPSNKTKFIVNAGGDSLAFLDKYEYITSGFVKKLNTLHIDNGFKGYSSLVFSLFLTSMLRGTKDWNFEDDVFHMADKLLKSPIKGTVRYDIENIIKKIWLLEEYETLKSEYYNFCFLKNHHKGYSAPSVEEFLTNMSSNNRISLKEIASSERSSKPFARHGELVNIHGEGVLVTGSSGVGKSDAVLELLKQGHCLIADDLVELRRMNNSIYGNACQESRNFMESRGVGIINVKRTIGAGAVREVERVDLVINLISLEDCKNLILMDNGGDENREYAPLGQAQNWVEISGVRIPYINILVQQGRNIANLIEIAALNNRQRFFGFVAENELFENLGMEGNETKSKVISEKELWGC